MRSRIKVILLCAALGGCAAAPTPRPGGGTATGPLKIGKPYRVAGTLYTPSDDRRFEQTGVASWYGEELRGRPTANGERFDPDGLTAAHRTLPMPSWVAVTARDTGRTIVVRVNDRGPFASNRIIDLSQGAARQLGITGRGSHEVRVRRVAGPDTRPASTLARQRDQSSSAVMPNGAGPWFVQVASFSSRDRAEDLADRLSARVVEGDGVWRVRIGPFDRADSARSTLARLAASGYPDPVFTR